MEAHQDAPNDPDEGKNAQNAYLSIEIPLVALSDIPAEELSDNPSIADDIVIAHDPAGRAPWLVVNRATGRRLGMFLTRGGAEQNARTLRAEMEA